MQIEFLNDYGYYFSKSFEKLLKNECCHFFKELLTDKRYCPMANKVLDISVENVDPKNKSIKMAFSTQGAYRFGHFECFYYLTNEDGVIYKDNTQEVQFKFRIGDEEKALFYWSLPQVVPITISKKESGLEYEIVFSHISEGKIKLYFEFELNQTTYSKVVKTFESKCKFAYNDNYKLSKSKKIVSAFVDFGSQMDENGVIEFLKSFSDIDNLLKITF